MYYFYFELTINVIRPTSMIRLLQNLIKLMTITDKIRNVLIDQPCIVATLTLTNTPIHTITLYGYPSPTLTTQGDIGLLHRFSSRHVTVM